MILDPFTHEVVVGPVFVVLASRSFGWKSFVALSKRSLKALDVAVRFAVSTAFHCWEIGSRSRCVDHDFRVVDVEAVDHFGDLVAFDFEARVRLALEPLLEALPEPVLPAPFAELRAVVPQIDELRFEEAVRLFPSSSASTTFFGLVLVLFGILGSRAAGRRRDPAPSDRPLAPESPCFDGVLERDLSGLRRE
jgi:hypothetical protein